MSTNADEGEKKGEESEGRCKNPRGVGGWVGATCADLHPACASELFLKALPSLSAAAFSRLQSRTQVCATTRAC